MVFFYDACAVIYLVEAVEPWYSQLKGILVRLGGHRAQHAVSELSLLECRVKPLHLGPTELPNRFDRFFNAPTLTRVPLKRQVVTHATELRAKFGLKTPDALQAACALSLPGEVLFLTNDQRFARVPNLDTRIIE